MDINKLTHEELINKIINQTNSLNKKIKAFKNKGIEEHSELIHNLLSDDQVQYNKSGSITKSKKFYDKQDDFVLKKTLATLIKINNHDIYGTVNKYTKYATVSWETLQTTVKETLRTKGYDEKFIVELCADKDFYNKLYLAFNEGALSYGSDQIIEKIVLDYSENGLSEEEIERISSDIEYSKNKMDNLRLEIEQYREYEREREEYERWKSQNRR